MVDRLVEDIAAQRKGAIKIGPFGSALPRSAMVQNGPKVYGQENLIARDWSIGNRRVKPETFELLRTCELHPGDVVIGMMGSLGHCEVFPSDVEPGLMDSHLLRIQVNEGMLSPEYLRHSLLSSNTTQQINRLSHGSIMAGLSSKVVRRVRLFVPPLEEQRRIAEILDAIDETIQATERVITKLRHAHAALQQQIVLRWNNGSVDEALLGALIDPNRPIVYGILMPGEHEEGGVPVVKVRDIKDGEIASKQSLLHTSPLIDQQYMRSRVRKGDILFTIRGTVGRTAIVPESLDGANITQDTARLSAVGVNRSYLIAAMSTEKFTRFVGVHTIGQAVKGINLRELRRAPIPLIGRDEQEIAGSVLDGSIELIDAQGERLKKLRLLRTGLAADLLSGRVRTVAA